jgi:uncharacterized membrane protein YfcA
MLVTAAALGLLIGFVVGAVGGGGGVLALPVLLYVLDQPAGPASTASLVVVAIAAAVGALTLARGGQVCWRLALTFFPPAAAGAALGAVANTAVSGRVLVLAFVPVMLAAAFAIWARAGFDARAPEVDTGCPQPPAPHILVAGFAVGLLTGFFGVGGGFLIVPVLTLWMDAGFRRAAATSLVIISLTGAVALASHLAAGATISADVTFALALPTAIGAIVGALVSGRLPQATLGRLFALVVALLALFLLVDVLVLGGPPGS